MQKDRDWRRACVGSIPKDPLAGGPRIFNIFPGIPPDRIRNHNPLNGDGGAFHFGPMVGHGLPGRSGTALGVSVGSEIVFVCIVALPRGPT